MFLHISQSNEPSKLQEKVTMTSAIKWCFFRVLLLLLLFVSRLFQVMGTCWGKSEATGPAWKQNNYSVLLPIIYSSYTGQYFHPIFIFLCFTKLLDWRKEVESESTYWGYALVTVSSCRRAAVHLGQVKPPDESSNPLWIWTSRALWTKVENVTHSN